MTHFPLVKNSRKINPISTSLHKNEFLGGEEHGMDNGTMGNRNFQSHATFRLVKPKVKDN